MDDDSLGKFLRERLIYKRNRRERDPHFDAKEVDSSYGANQILNDVIFIRTTRDSGEVSYSVKLVKKIGKTCS